MKRIILLLPCFLSGCITPFSSPKEKADYILSRGWVGDSEPQPPPQPLYCYETLGKKDCYERPLEKAKSRLVAYY